MGEPLMTFDDVPVENVCDVAKKALRDVLILGVDHDGQFYAASSTGDARLYIAWIEEFMHKMSHDEYLFEEVEE